MSQVVWADNDISAVAGADLSWGSCGSWRWTVARCELGIGISDSVDEAEFLDRPEDTCLYWAEFLVGHVQLFLHHQIPGWCQATGIMKCQAIYGCICMLIVVCFVCVWLYGLCAYGCMVCVLMFNFVNYVFLLLCLYDCLFITFFHVPLFPFFYHCIYGCVFCMLLFFLVNYVFLLFVYVFLLLCMFCSVYSVFIMPTGTLRLHWLRFFLAFSSVVRQMPGYNSQRQGTARTLRSMYCLCVNVYCTAATGWQPNCS